MARRRDGGATHFMEYPAEVRVRFNEVDPLDIVWHGHYLKYFEEGREALGRAVGLSYPDMRREGFAAPVVKATVDYLAPARYGDLLLVMARLIRCEPRKLRLTYRVTREGGDLLARGETVQVFTDFSGKMLLQPPPYMVAWHRKHATLWLVDRA